jgi:hypothetical protein
MASVNGIYVGPLEEAGLPTIARISGGPSLDAKQLGTPAPR